MADCRLFIIALFSCLYALCVNMGVVVVIVYPCSCGGGCGCGWLFFYVVPCVRVHYPTRFFLFWISGVRLRRKRERGRRVFMIIRTTTLPTLPAHTRTKETRTASKDKQNKC